MGTIVARGSKYRAVVRMKGVEATKTFSKKTLARAWITDTEASIERRQIFAKGHTLGTILDRYRTEVIDKKPFQRKYRRGPHKGSVRPSAAHFHVRRLARKFHDIDLSKCTPDWWVSEFAKFNCKPQSRTRYLTLISSALTAAEEQDGITIDWLSFRRGKARMSDQGLIAKGRRRKRRPTDEEVADIKAQILKTKSKLPMGDIIDFARTAGLRETEICQVRWADLNEVRKMLLVRDRKHPKEKMGNHFNVPLLGDAFDIVMRQPRTSEFIFPYNPETIGNLFRDACAALGIEDLVFHDLRHEAISRLFEYGYAIQEVALVSGHSNWASLQIYTQLDPESLHAGPLRKRVEHTS
jgi:integrase